MSSSSSNSDTSSVKGTNSSSESLAPQTQLNSGETAVSSLPEALRPSTQDNRLQPWKKWLDIKEKESAHVKGDDLRLLGGRVNAHGS